MLRGSEMINRRTVVWPLILACPYAVAPFNRTISFLARNVKSEVNVVLSVRLSILSNRLRKKSGFCYAPGLPAGIMEASLLDFLR
jgi:hypothetical protein